MGNKRTTKRLAVAAIAIAGLTGGAMAVHADTFDNRIMTPPAGPPASWPSIPMTCSVDPCDVGLYAGPDSVVVHDVNNGGTVSVPFFGFGVNSGTAVGLAGSAVSTIKVAEGTTVNITLTQDPAVIDAIDLSFPSLPLGTDTNPDPNVFSFVASADMVGTSVFQPGANADAPRQIAMGLVGVLIVTPTGCESCAVVGGTASNDEALLASADLDLEFATDYTDGGPFDFSMSYFGKSGNPDGSPRQVYHLINGQSFPDTEVIDVAAADTVLLRIVNAGVTDKSMGSLGLRQTLLARNSQAYTDPQTLIAPLVGPGETADVSISVPADALVGQFYSLVDQGRQMNHGNGYGFGGAVTFLDVRSAV